MSHPRTTRVLAALSISALASPALAQSQSQRLTPTGPLTSDIFAYGMAFDGAVAVFGAPFATYSGVSQPGRAFIFEKVGNNWTQSIKLQPPILQEGAAFGTEVAAGAGPDGEVVAIGASGEDGDFTDSGAVYIYEKVAGVWTLTKKLTPPTPEASTRFGAALAISNGTLAIGAPGVTVNDIQYAGSAYLYEKIAGVWTLTATLISPDPAEADTFGANLAIDRDRLVVTAPLDDTDDTGETTDAGAAYTFLRTNNTWVYDNNKLLASPPTFGQQFGSAVAIKNGLIAVAAENAAIELIGDKAGIVCTFRLINETWTPGDMLASPTPKAGAHFGTDVAIDGREILVGSYLESLNGHTGVAHIFRERLGQWWFDSTLVANDTGGTLFGWRIALAGDTAMVSGPFYQTNRGAAYVETGMRACNADIDGTGFVDTDDFDAYVHAFEDSLPYADMDGSGFIDTDDFDLFVHTFQAGC